MKKILFIGIMCWSVLACKTVQLKYVPSTNTVFSVDGRTLRNTKGGIELISSGALVEFQFSGDSCVIALNNIAGKGDYNFVSIELDGAYQGRLKIIDSQPNSFTIKTKKTQDWHSLRIYKATEAANGIIGFYGANAKDIKKLPSTAKLRIEFIGNSITCGMGNDTQEIPCGTNKWYDQHNAYWSYATLVARAMNAHFTLSSVSGSGIYRNWNSDGPTVPQVYESAYLQNDSTKRWNFKTFTPDIVSIALGTNDLSAGDGKKQRLPFEEKLFVDTYVKFIKNIASNYPNAQIVLITSPMVTGERGKILSTCLRKVQSIVLEEKITNKTVKVFEFTPIKATGCGGHPIKAEHEQMANQLLPFIEEVASGLK